MFFLLWASSSALLVSSRGTCTGFGLVLSLALEFPLLLAHLLLIGRLGTWDVGLGFLLLVLVFAFARALSVVLRLNTANALAAITLTDSEIFALTLS